MVERGISPILEWLAKKCEVQRIHKERKKMMVLSAETCLFKKITGLCHKNVHNSQK